MKLRTWGSATLIIGALLVITSSAWGQTTVYLPTVRTSPDPLNFSSTSGEIRPIELPIDVVYPAPGEIKSSVSMTDAIKWSQSADVVSTKEIPASGELTRGGIISVLDRQIQLPEDVEVETFIASIDCLVGKECPAAPVYLLRNVSADLRFGVSSSSGELLDIEKDLARDEARSLFDWLVDSPVIEGSRILLATPTDYVRPHYVDIERQQPITNDEHFTFQLAYLHAMSSTEDPPYVIKHFTWFSDPTPWLDAYYAVSSWNNVKPSGWWNATEAADSTSADLRIRWQSCPLPDPNSAVGCFSVTVWQGITWGTGTIPPNYWKKADIYVRPTSSTFQYDGLTRRSIIVHEIGHALGLNDQVMTIPSNRCNSQISTIMDGFTVQRIGTVDHANSCDNYSSPSTVDSGMWSNYQTRGFYLPYTSLVYPSGELAFSWYDYAANDWQMEHQWQWAPTSSGPWTTTDSYTTFHVSDNGSYYPIPDPTAQSRRIVVKSYPSIFGVHNKWVRGCAKPMFNYMTNAPTVDWRCSSAVWYPY